MKKVSGKGDSAGRVEVHATVHGDEATLQDAREVIHERAAVQALAVVQVLELHRVYSRSLARNYVKEWLYDTLTYHTSPKLLIGMFQHPDSE